MCHSNSKEICGIKSADFNTDRFSILYSAYNPQVSGNKTIVLDVDSPTYKVSSSSNQTISMELLCSKVQEREPTKA